MDPELRVAALEHAARVKHDLGKYVAFQLRWLPPDAPLADRVDALRADLLSTRRGPDGAVDAPTLWAELRAPLVGEVPLPGGAHVNLSNDPAVVAIDAAIAEIRDVVAGLDGADVALVEAGTRAALAVAEAARDLHRRLREG